MSSSDSQLTPPSKELRRLVDGLFAESLTRVEFARLEELLENDPASLRYYLEVSANEALLPIAAAGEDFKPSLPVRKPRQLTLFSAGIAAAAALIMAYAIGLSRSGPTNDPEVAKSPLSSSSQAVRITGGVGVVWEKGDPASALAIGSELPQPEVAIESGLLELTYANGVNLLLEGPARYTVMGDNSGALGFGNLVAEVPPGAEGFSIDYAGDRLVDHGTQFGLRLPKDTGIPEVAVFRGEVEVFSGKHDIPARLTRDHAVRRSEDNDGVLESIPLDRSRYARELPSRELPWKMPPVRLGETTRLEFEVSDLIRKQGDYHFIFKWMTGRDDLHLRDVQLHLDGVLINSEIREGATGKFPASLNNSYQLKVPPGSFRSGRWILSATVWCTGVNHSDRASESQGVLLVEEGGLVGKASLEDCIGTWEYWHDGLLWTRELHPDGGFTLSKVGQVQTRGLWEARDGGLLFFFPREQVYERHILRDQNTLIFLDQPYRNAFRN